MNRGVKLARRPLLGSPVSLECFALSEMPTPPVASLSEGEVMASTEWLSADPYMRCRFEENTGVDYVAPFPVGSLITSAGVGMVLESRRPGVHQGDLVAQPTFHWPWAETSVLRADVELQVVSGPMLAAPQRLLGVCGVTGLTGYFSVQGELASTPLQGSTVVVSAAAGATGMVACQMARSRGAKVVGVCGSGTKGEYLLSHGICQAVVNYKAPDFPAQLAEATGGAVDVHIDSVGGEVNDQIIQLMTRGGKIVLVGAISQYNDPSVPYPPPLSAASQALVDERQIVRERYLVLAYQEQFVEATARLFHMVESGDMQAPETVLHGIENAPQAFIDVMAGANLGKQLIQLKLKNKD